MFLEDKLLKIGRDFEMENVTEGIINIRCKLIVKACLDSLPESGVNLTTTQQLNQFKRVNKTYVKSIHTLNKEGRDFFNENGFALFVKASHKNLKWIGDILLKQAQELDFY